MAKVFFSYSHKDEALRDQLQTHLALLQSQGLIESWHDRRIVVGSEVDEAVSEAMESSEVVLLLISADFMASKYCYSREMVRAMERHDAKQARVIPVILRDCDWHSAPFGELLATPTDGRAVTLWPDIDQAFTNVAKQIRRALEEQAGVAPASLPAAMMRAGSPSTIEVTATSLPRSSNLAMAKVFSEQDRDDFLRAGFDYISRFFEGSINAVAERNAGVTGRFERVDIQRFTAVLYRQGKAISECSIRLGGFGRRSSGIVFSYDIAATNSHNEMLSVESNPQTMFFRSSGMQIGGSGRDAQLSPEGAAEFLWGLFFDRVE
jgi:hypothetical protein